MRKDATLKRVLVADDERYMREIIREILLTEGCEVDEAADGSEAFRLLATGAYDLIFLDLHMPNVSGLEFLKKVWSDRGSVPTGDVPPIVIVSGYCEELRTWQAALQEKIAGVLPKPFSPQQLVRTAREALAKAATSPSVAP